MGKTGKKTSKEGQVGENKICGDAFIRQWQELKIKNLVIQLDSWCMLSVSVDGQTEYTVFSVWCNTF